MFIFAKKSFKNKNCIDFRNTFMFKWFFTMANPD